MTLFAKTARTAVAAAVVAATAFAILAAPAQAEYQLAPSGPINAGKYYSLRCVKSSGDVVADPIVINNTRKTLAIGKKIHLRAKLANGTIYYGTYTLTRPLFSGHARRITKNWHWQFTCTAKVWA